MAVNNFPIGLVAASVGKSREEFVAEGGRARPQTSSIPFVTLLYRVLGTRLHAPHDRFDAGGLLH